MVYIYIIFVCIYGSYTYIFTFSKGRSSKITHYPISVQEVGHLFPWNPHVHPLGLSFRLSCAIVTLCVNISS